MMKRVYDFLNEAKTYYLATMEGNQPRVRPFGTVLLFEDKLYIQTGKVKPVSKQIEANGKVEICAMKGDEWIRVAGTLVEDNMAEFYFKEKDIEGFASGNDEDIIEYSGILIGMERMRSNEYTDFWNKEM